MKHKLIHKALTKLTGGLIALTKPSRPFIFSGSDSSLQLCDAIVHMPPKKLMVVSDKILIGLGVVAPMLERLETAGIDYVIYDGVEPDPSFDVVHKGIDLFKSSDCDAILSVGGGSTIDTAKGILAHTTTGKPLEKLIGNFKLNGTPVRHYCVPTTAGTGSEVTYGAVLTTPKGDKGIMADPRLVPSMAALDAKVTSGLPPAITAATGIDALTHAVEAHISCHATEESMGYSRAASNLIMKNLVPVYDNGSNLDGRQALLTGSCYSGIALNRAALGYIHSIAHALGGLYHVPHGLANAIVMPYVLEYSLQDAKERLADLAIASGLGDKSEDPLTLAQRYIERIRVMKQHMGIPEKVKELRKEDIATIANLAINESYGVNGVPTYMSFNDCCGVVNKMLP
jgi:alcohol dehydrogenase class IV